MVKMQIISRKYSKSIHECLNKRELQVIKMKTSSPLEKRSQREIIKLIQNSECQWLECEFRVNPQNKTYFTQYESKRHTLQTIKWTVGYIKNEFNDGNNLLFLPFWGGEFSTGVARHVHAFLEMPAQINDDFKDKTQIKMNALAKKAFRSSASTDFHMDKISNSYIGIQKFGNYCMRFEGKQFGYGTNKMIAELAYWHH